MKKTMIFAAVLFSVMLLLPVVTGDVYVPPGPGANPEAWVIAPWHEFPGGETGEKIPFYWWVMDLQDESTVGWYYTDGPPVDLCKVGPTRRGNRIFKDAPWIPVNNTLDIPWSTEVMILGFIPKVYVPPGEVPPPVQLVITWNGIPYTVTLETNETVPFEYPWPVPEETKVPYAYAWPPESPYKDAYYNIWVGDMADLMKHFGTDIQTLYPDYYETYYGMYNGYWFWYRFHPNVGDWIAWNCEGQTKFPPTYDITALFECGTSQIWFPHVCFDVSLLEVHKMVDWVDDDKISDFITIENVGKGNATELDFIQTFPYEQSKFGGHGVMLNEAWTPKARIDFNRTVNWTPLPGFVDAMLADERYNFQAPFDYLNPNETMSIWLLLDVINFDDWSGTIVFDSMVSAKEIPPWKEPIALHHIVIGDPTGDNVYLWTGWELDVNWPNEWGSFELVEKWEVQMPILRDKLTHPPPKMVLDPVPVDLNGDGTINALDVSLVRQAIVGLVAYDQRMDVNVNGEIDTQDLAAYKLAAN